MSSLESLADLMHDELKVIYDAEKQLTKALPKLVKKATNEPLRDALQRHLKETEGHVERLEQIFEQLGLPAKGKKCEGMRHLIEEGNDLIGPADEDATRDAVMIAAATTSPQERATKGRKRKLGPPAGAVAWRRAQADERWPPIARGQAIAAAGKVTSAFFLQHVNGR